MYRTFETSFWTDPKIRKHHRDTMWLAAYLFTNPMSHVSGLYVFRKSVAAEDLKLSMPAFNKAFSALLKQGFCFWDDERQVIWVKNMFRRQGVGGPKIANSVAKHLGTLHNSPLIPLFLEYYSKFNIPYRYTTDRVSDTVSVTDGYSSVPGTGTGTVPDSDPVPDKSTQPQGTSTRKKLPLLTDPDELREALSAIDITKHREKWEPKGLDVDAAWQDFHTYVMEGDAKQSWPNPAEWRNFSRAFDDSCGRDVRDGRNMKGVSKRPKQNYITETKLD